MKAQRHEILQAGNPMSDAQPKREDAGRMFYDGREAWTVKPSLTRPVWVRVAEKDIWHIKESKRAPTRAPASPHPLQGKSADLQANFLRRRNLRKLATRKLRAWLMPPGV